MPSDKGPRSVRTRLTFDVEPALLGAVEELAKERHTSVREVGLEAMKRYLEPDLRFTAPREANEEPIQRFLSGAQQVIMVGISLSSLHQSSVQDYLRERIERDHVLMTFLFLDPDIDETNIAYQVLNKRYEGMYANGLKAELAKTRAVLEELRRAGERVYAPVRILGIQSLPMSGLTIVDPLSEAWRVRVAMYLHIYPHELHPFFDVRANHAEGTQACYAFHRHYERLAEAARLLSEPLS